MRYSTRLPLLVPGLLVLLVPLASGNVSTRTLATADQAVVMPAPEEAAREMLASFNHLPLSRGLHEVTDELRDARDAWPEGGTPRREAMADWVHASRAIDHACQFDLSRFVEYLVAARPYPVLHDARDAGSGSALNPKLVRVWNELLGLRARSLAAEGYGEAALSLIATDWSHWRRVALGSGSASTLMLAQAKLGSNLVIAEDVLALDPRANLAESDLWEELTRTDAFSAQRARALRAEFEHRQEDLARIDEVLALGMRVERRQEALVLAYAAHAPEAGG